MPVSAATAAPITATYVESVTPPSMTRPRLGHADQDPHRAPLQFENGRASRFCTSVATDNGSKAAQSRRSDVPGAIRLYGIFRRSTSMPDASSSFRSVNFHAPAASRGM